MNPAAIFSVLFILGVTYLMASAYALRWMIDEEKIKVGGAKIFRAITPPREVLTPVGVKIWWSRWIAGAATIVFLGLSFHFRSS